MARGGQIEDCGAHRYVQLYILEGVTNYHRNSLYLPSLRCSVLVYSFSKADSRSADVRSRFNYDKLVIVHRLKHSIFVSLF